MNTYTDKLYNAILLHIDYSTIAMNKMTNTKLHEELERLRSEVNRLTDDNIDAKEKLNLLISDIEKKLEKPSDEAHHRNLIEDIRNTINQFETDHPRATAILNDIMVTLSNMGI